MGRGHEPQRLAVPVLPDAHHDGDLCRAGNDGLVVEVKSKAAMAAAARNKAVIARFLGDEKMWREALVKLGQAMRRVQ
ncbi:hypothetical protein [Sodalis sp. RH16]|uniref:host cell division inhibitory peptide Kil n=1 Tax=Sodalis sp. RH16 TaxID=3394331 RepID=UPI0039B62BDB